MKEKKMFRPFANEHRILHQALLCYKEVCKRSVAARKPDDSNMQFWRDEFAEVTRLVKKYDPAAS